MCASGYDGQRALLAGLAPPATRSVCLGRGGKFTLPDPDSAPRVEERVIVMAERLAALEERYCQRRREQQPKEEQQQ